MESLQLKDTVFVDYYDNLQLLSECDLYNLRC